MDSVRPGLDRSSALKFIVLLGFVSLLADITYEGARSITGPFMAVLGASAAAVGFISGLGEMTGYVLRLASGYLTDKISRHWAIMLAGYAMNLVAVPMLALAGSWEIAAALILAERAGKAIRTPARDALLASATGRVGAGWGFGLHEAMDKLGSLMGPLIVSAVIYVRGGYRAGFALLAVPAFLALAALIVARAINRDPSRFEDRSASPHAAVLPTDYWIYLVAVACVAAGYADFPLIAYHFKRMAIATDAWIPILYSIAMGVDALAALAFGRVFDRIGGVIMVAVTLLSSLAAPLVFLFGFRAALIGMALWGIGMGAQQSVIRAIVAGMVPFNKRGSAYGIFNTGYGLAWFAGSALMGLLYDRSILALVVFSMAIQLLAIPFFVVVLRRSNAARAYRDSIDARPSSRV